MVKDDQVMQELFNPLLQAIGSQHKDALWKNIETEGSGMLAWGVQSGYFLWVRTNPGMVPSKEQVVHWMQQGKLP
jgi:hypothetical protein